MNRTLKTLAVVLLLAIVPLRGLAAVTVGFCAMGHHEAPAQAYADHGAHHHHEAPAEPKGKADCSVCVEHCSSASFAVPAPLELFLPNRSGRIALGEHFAAGFVPDHLDPPPLVL